MQQIATLYCKTFIERPLRVKHKHAQLVALPPPPPLLVPSPPLLSEFQSLSNRRARETVPRGLTEATATILTMPGHKMGRGGLVAMMGRVDIAVTIAITGATDGSERT